MAALNVEQTHERLLALHRFVTVRPRAVGAESATVRVGGGFELGGRGGRARGEGRVEV